MIIAMIAMRMMQMPIHQIVCMVSMRYRLMPATGSMDVTGIVSPTCMLGSATLRVRCIHRKRMLIIMPLMGMMQMPVMQIVYMTVMFDSHMTAIGTMLMIAVIGVNFVFFCHFSYLFL